MFSLHAPTYQIIALLSVNLDAINHPARANVVPQISQGPYLLIHILTLSNEIFIVVARG